MVFPISKLFGLGFRTFFFQIKNLSSSIQKKLGPILYTHDRFCNAKDCMECKVLNELKHVNTKFNN